MYNGYLQLQPLKGVSGQEATAFTKKTIKQLLAEEAEAMKAEATAGSVKTALPAETSPVRPALIKPTPMPKSVLQQPPQMHTAMPKPATAPLASAPAEAPKAKPRSFLKRLINR